MKLFSFRATQAAPSIQGENKKTLKHECQSACAGNNDVYTCAIAAVPGLAMDERRN